VTDWPLGGMAAGALASTEAFKTAMRKLSAFAKNPSHFFDMFAPADTLEFELAPPNSPQTAELGPFDCISAGAIINCSLYAILRILGVHGTARIFDDDFGDVSNLNRNPLLLRSMISRPKASALASMQVSGLRLEPILSKYKGPIADFLPNGFAPWVLVGVDHIPTRWDVQRAMPRWLGVGATSHWSAMASFHVAGLGCAGCLHPTDDRDYAVIPTVAFVSFWAGLHLASLYLRAAAGESISPLTQQIYLTALRPETPWRTPVQRRGNCPVEVHNFR
jgi:hypothetical protein